MTSLTDKLIHKIFAPKKKDSNVKIPDEDFIPYVCHIDPTTIITKNGELIQIIRVTGFSNKADTSEVISLRDAVRDSIKRNVKETNIAFWFNTLRRRKNISPRGDFSDELCAYVNRTWEDQYNLKYDFVNELYITIIIEGVDSSVSNFSSLVRSFSKIATRSLHHSKINDSHQKLNNITSKILDDLQDYGAKLLGLKEWQGVLYSQPMRFFGKLVNLYEERYPLVFNDIANDLSSHKIAFGSREIEVVGYNNKNFSAIFSLKEYFETTTTSLDRVLQLPFEFIITQSFDFAYNENDINSYENQDYILKVSGDEEFRQISGIANFMESKTGNATDYGKLQTTFMIVSKSKEDLLNDIKIAVEEFSQLGFVLVHEDIFMEHCFWAQLPANFSFLRRQKLINTYRVAGFSSLNSFPSGSIAGNHWGSAVCVFKTVLNTPFFFNFHDGNNGHTLIIGPKGSGKTMFSNFLIAQSQKFNPKVFIFDFENASQAFIELLGGQYYDFNIDDINNKNFIKLNPLKLSSNIQNKNFLSNFFESLVIFRKNKPSAQQLEIIPDIVDRIYAANCQNFYSAVEAFNNNDSDRIYDDLKIWSDGKLSAIFNHEQDFEFDKFFTAFDLTKYLDQKPVLLPIFLYLLHRIETSLDGSPSIIVINKFIDLISNIIFQPQIQNILDRLRLKNCLVIFNDDDTKIESNLDLIKTVQKAVSTEIFLPNDNPQDNIYKDIFGFSKEEVEIIKMMEINERHFLLRHAEESLIATINLGEIFAITKILASDQRTLTVVQTIIGDYCEKNNTTKPNIQEVLPLIIEAINAIENERITEETEALKNANQKAREELKMRLESE